FPANREKTGNFVILMPVEPIRKTKSAGIPRVSTTNSLNCRTGNFKPPNREFSPPEQVKIGAYQVTTLSALAGRQSRWNAAHPVRTSAPDGNRRRAPSEGSPFFCLARPPLTVRFADSAVVCNQ